MAEGSFGMKIDGSAFYQLKQKGADNLYLLKAACLIITGPRRELNSDSTGAYQLSLSSKKDIEKAISFFSSSNRLCGYKLSQYTILLNLLKKSSRYSHIFLQNSNE